MTSGSNEISGEAATHHAARTLAREAAARSGVEIHELSDRDVTFAADVIRQVWGEEQVPQDNLLRAFAHAGSTLLGAIADGRPVGVTLGFLGWAGGSHLHSHMTAVLSDHQSSGVGYALKLWQRAVCLREGVTEIRWTYDPLVARNAYFNLSKLGAVVRSFHRDFYGAMDDVINAGDDSDRFEVSWWLESDRVQEALAGRPPAVTEVVGSHEVPDDYHSLLRSDPKAAREARLRTRAALARAQHEGLVIEWGQRKYLFAPPAANKEPRSTVMMAGDG